MILGHLIFFLLICKGTLTLPSAAQRIIGGQPATIEQYPQAVQVESRLLFVEIWVHLCGGTILHPRWILTAAQCFDGTVFNPSMRRIRAGATNRQSGGSLHSILRSINHPDYRSNSFNADISLLELELDSTLVFSESVRSASFVAPRVVLDDGLPVTLVGWGATTPESGSSENLQAVTTATINNSICRDSYADLLLPTYTVTENMICTGHLALGGAGACHNDPGGPIFNGNVVVGVISWSWGCAESGYPSVGTYVSPYTNWIVSTVMNREMEL